MSTNQIKALENIQVQQWLMELSWIAVSIELEKKKKNLIDMLTADKSNYLKLSGLNHCPNFKLINFQTFTTWDKSKWNFRWFLFVCEA